MSDRHGIVLAYAAAPGAPRPAEGFCSSCREPMPLETAPFETIGAGERGYTCPSCGERTVFYSSAWLDKGRG